MNYKIAIVKNRTDDSNIKRIADGLMEYFGEKTPLKIRVDIFDTDGDVEVKFFKVNHEGRRVHGTANGKDFARTVIKEGEYHQVIFCYDLEDTGFTQTEIERVTAWSFWKELMPGTEYTEIPVGRGLSNSWERRTALHETMHAFVKRVNRSGRTIIDHMDSTIVDGQKVDYYHNDDPNHPSGNYARTFNELKNYWDVVASTERADEYVALKKRLGDLVKKASEMQAKTTEKQAIEGNMVDPTYLGIHHGADARPLKLSEMKRIYQDTHYENLYLAHNQPRSRSEDYPDIAYHLLVGIDGWEWMRDPDIYGYHISDRAVNKDSIALCVTGNFSEYEVNETLDKYAREAIADARKKFPSIKYIVPHNKYANKVCPGVNITSELMLDWFNNPVKQKQEVVFSPAVKEMIEMFNKYPELSEYKDAVIGVIKNKLEVLIKKKNEQRNK